MLNTVGYNFTYVHLLINVCTYVEGNSSSNHRGLIALLGLRRGGDSGNHMRRRRTGAKGISGFSRGMMWIFVPRIATTPRIVCGSFVTRFSVTVYLGNQNLVSDGKMISLISINDSGKTWAGYSAVCSCISLLPTPEPGITRPRGGQVGPSNTLQQSLPKP